MKMSVKIPFTADIRGFEKGLSEMRAKYKGFGDFLKKNRKALILGGGTAVFGAMATGFKMAAENASNLTNMSKEAKTNVEALQVALLLGRDTGAAQEQVVAALKNINSRAVDAANGAKNYQQALRRLNIDYKEFVDLPTERKLEMIAKGYMQTGEDAQAYRDILTLLGEDAGPKLIGVLQRMGTDGFDVLNSKMKESGKIIREDVIGSLNEAEKAAEKALQQAGGRFSQGAGMIAQLFGFGDKKDIDATRATIKDALLKPFGAGTFFSFEDQYAEEQGKLEEERIKKSIAQRKAGAPDNKQKEARKRQLEQIAKEEQAEKNKNDFIAGIMGQAKKDASAMDKDNAALASSVGKLKTSIASVPVSSLQAIGGGGNVSSVGMSQVQILRSQEQLLRQIAKNTEYKGQGPMSDQGAKAG